MNGKHVLIVIMNIDIHLSEQLPTAIIHIPINFGKI